LPEEELQLKRRVYCFKYVGTLNLTPLHIAGTFHGLRLSHLQSYLKEYGIKNVGEVRYDTAITKAQIMKTSVVEYTEGAISEDIKHVWRNTIYALG